MLPEFRRAAGIVLVERFGGVVRPGVLTDVDGDTGKGEGVIAVDQAAVMIGIEVGQDDVGRLDALFGQYPGQV